jgi:hypothetical protein
MEYSKGRIYPNSVPEFCHLQKVDGTIEMQVRYINSAQGYTGKWTPLQMKKENDITSSTKA